MSETTNYPTIERRIGERRADRFSSRLFLRAQAMQRAFGTNAAMKLLVKAGTSVDTAEQILRLRKDRRINRGRV